MRLWPTVWSLLAQVPWEREKVILPPSAEAARRGPCARPTATSLPFRLPGRPLPRRASEAPAVAAAFLPAALPPFASCSLTLTRVETCVFPENRPLYHHAMPFCTPDDSLCSQVAAPDINVALAACRPGPSLSAIRLSADCVSPCAWVSHGQHAAGPDGLSELVRGGH